MGTAFQVFLRMHTSVANLVMYSRKSPEEEASLCLRYSHFAVDIWYAFNAPALISVCRQVFMCVSRHSPLLSTNLCAVLAAILIDVKALLGLTLLLVSVLAWASAFGVFDRTTFRHSL